MLLRADDGGLRARRSPNADVRCSRQAALRVDSRAPIITAMLVPADVTAVDRYLNQRERLENQH